MRCRSSSNVVQAMQYIHMEMLNGHRRKGLNSKRSCSVDPCIAVDSTQIRSDLIYQSRDTRFRKLSQLGHAHQYSKGCCINADRMGSFADAHAAAAVAAVDYTKTSSSFLADSPAYAPSDRMSLAVHR